MKKIFLRKVREKYIGSRWEKPLVILGVYGIMYKAKELTRRGTDRADGEVAVCQNG
ncbi:MAG: hypothetical protein Q4D60_08805 [Eubacteriales bacterium]|nr:hypothetical protein [Eubacteriales bacterium]